MKVIAWQIIFPDTDIMGGFGFDIAPTFDGLVARMADLELDSVKSFALVKIYEDGSHQHVTL